MSPSVAKEAFGTWNPSVRCWLFLDHLKREQSLPPNKSDGTFPASDGGGGRLTEVGLWR